MKNYFIPFLFIPIYFCDTNIDCYNTGYFSLSENIFTISVYQDIWHHWHPGEINSKIKLHNKISIWHFLTQVNVLLLLFFWQEMETFLLWSFSKAYGSTLCRSSRFKIFAISVAYFLSSFSRSSLTAESVLVYCRTH